MGEIFGGISLCKSYANLFNQLKNVLLLIPFENNLEREKFSTLIRAGGTFLDDKRPNKIETIQHFKKSFLQTSLRSSMGSQNHWKRSDLGQSLYPSTQDPRLESNYPDSFLSHID